MPSDLAPMSTTTCVRGQLQDRALDDAIFADGFFGFGGEGFQRGGKIFGGWLWSWLVYLPETWSCRRVGVEDAAFGCAWCWCPRWIRVLLGLGGNGSGGIRSWAVVSSYKVIASLIPRTA